MKLRANYRYVNQPGGRIDSMAFYGDEIGYSDPIFGTRHADPRYSIIAARALCARWNRTIQAQIAEGTRNHFDMCVYWLQGDPKPTLVPTARNANESSLEIPTELRSSNGRNPREGDT